MKKILKIIAKVLIILTVTVLFAFLAEAFFHVHRFSSDSAAMILETPRLIGKIGKNNLHYEFESEQPVFLEKVCVHGSVVSAQDYAVSWTGQNPFGNETAGSVVDIMYSAFPSAYTNIRRDVTSVRITVPYRKTAEAQIDNVELIFHTERNKYRMAFFAGIAFLVTSAVCFRSLFRKKPEYFFAMAGLVFGTMLILYSGTKYASWDEEIHFRNMYVAGSGRKIEWSEAYWQYFYKQLPDINTYEETGMLNNYMNLLGESVRYTVPNNNRFIDYNEQIYLVSAAGFKLGNRLHLPFSKSYQLGEAANLLLYLILVFIAIRIAKKGKLLILMVSLLPTVVFQNSTFSYDGPTFSLLLLGTVLWLNEMCDAEKKLTVRNTMLMLFCLAIGSFAKAVYSPLLLLLLLLPKEKYSGKKERILFQGIVCCVFLLLMSTFVVPTLVQTAAGNIHFGGDPRGGDTSVVGQLMSMLQHPAATVKLLFRSITAFDNFRNLGSTRADSFNAFNLLALNFAAFGVLPDKWVLLFLPFIVIRFIAAPAEENGTEIRRRHRFAIVIILLMIVALIWVSLYLSFTPVGANYISGVQARYYLPLLVPVGLLTQSRRIQYHYSPDAYALFTHLMCILMAGECIYRLILLPCCS